MKLSYYPGCALKAKAKTTETSLLAIMSALGFQLEELPYWNCCGAVSSLSQDDLIHQIAPIRVLIRALEHGTDKLITLCSMCYNTLARANLLMRSDQEKMRTINAFMDEECDYHGEVEVIHLLSLLRDEIGWKQIAKRVVNSLSGMRVAPYYGCTLTRPTEVSIENRSCFDLMPGLLEALGAKVVNFPAKDFCCGSYQIVGNPKAAEETVLTILEWAERRKAETIALSCPLCEFNLLRNQAKLLCEGRLNREIRIQYFTDLLAGALGVVSSV
jgi:heterodisulfide reductase subunit B